MINTTESVAVIGLGRMGSAMARRFHAAGLRLTLWNRSREKAEALSHELAGANVADTPAAASAEANVVVTSLADDAAVSRVYLTEDGVVKGLQSESVAVDTSTIDPTTVLEVAAAFEEHGKAGFLDCPVSGSVATVESGGLTVMAGGDPQLVDRVDPVLSAIASNVIRVGPLGNGAACKLAVNALVHGLNVALSEALVLAERAGVHRDVAYEVFASGAASAPFVLYKREAYLDPEHAPVAFTLNLVAKDLELITGLAGRVNAPMSQANAGLELVQKAVAQGLGEEDLSAIAVYLRGSSG